MSSTTIQCVEVYTCPDTSISVLIVVYMWSDEMGLMRCRIEEHTYVPPADEMGWMWCR